MSGSSCPIISRCGLRSTLSGFQSTLPGFQSTLPSFQSTLPGFQSMLTGFQNTLLSKYSSQQSPLHFHLIMFPVSSNVIKVTREFALNWPLWNLRLKFDLLSKIFPRVWQFTFEHFRLLLILDSCFSWNHVESWRRQPSKSSKVFWVINQVFWDLNSGIIGLQNALMKIPFQHFKIQILRQILGKIWCRGKSKKYKPLTFNNLWMCPLYIEGASILFWGMGSLIRSYWVNHEGSRGLTKMI